MERPKAVVDASVVAKWFLEEEHSENARRLRDAFATDRLVLSAPSVLLYETLNALWASGLFDEDELALASRSLCKYGFDLWEPAEGVLERSARISYGKGITVYDSSYVALARHLGTALFTADEELVRKFPDVAKHIGRMEEAVEDGLDGTRYP